MAKTDDDFDVQQHVYVPKHTKLSDEEKVKLLERFNVSLHQFPQIRKNDPAIAKLETKPGDVIKIERKSKFLGKTNYYRVVV